MPTERGKIIIFALGLTLILAWYIQIELIYFISAILASIFCVSLLIFKIMLVKINIDRILPNVAYEDESLKIKVVVENKSPFDSYFVYVTDNFPADISYRQQKKILFNYLPKRATISKNYEGFCFKRGAYLLGPFVLITSDPLGLFRKYKIVNVSSKLTVYPNLFNISSLASFNKGMVTPRYGPHTSRRSGDYEEFFGIREYQQEDGLRKIHWPSTAKRNQLLVRHFEQSATHAASIVIDLKWENNLGAGRETTLEYAIKTAGSLAKYFLNQGYMVQLLAYSDRPIISSFGRDPSHFSTILNLLAQMEANSSLTLAESLSSLSYFIPHNSTLVSVRLDRDIDAARYLKQLIYTKNIALYDIQLVSSSFDKDIPKTTASFLEAMGSEVVNYSISCGDHLELKFMPK